MEAFQIPASRRWDEKQELVEWLGEPHQKLRKQWVYNLGEQNQISSRRTEL
jgi:hypothetical protein